MESWKEKRGIYRYCLIVCLALGVLVRFAGLTRGNSDFILPERAWEGRAFYHFHPDEETLVETTLGFSSPLESPPTAYGILPIYLLKVCLKIAAILPGGPEGAETRWIYYTARTASALIACLTLWLVWRLGCRYGGQETGCLATFFVALAPMAIQQAHFFTVDGLFTLMNLAAFGALLRAVETEDRRWQLAAGLLIGGAAGVRLIGLLTGMTLAAGFLLKGESPEGQTRWQQAKRNLLRPHLWLAGGAALATLLSLEPYLLRNLEGLWVAESPDGVGGNFHGRALQVARGEILRPWTLVDVDTTPYLHHWISLFPLGVGWPLTVFFLLGAAWSLWRFSWWRGLILLWCVLYFAVVGGLHSKHIRYLLPLLPFLSILAADVCCRLVRSRRWVGGIVAVCLIAYSGAYGLAFTRIYLAEDSRLEAGRWIAGRVPPGSRIGVEGGGFSLQGVVSAEVFHRQIIDILPLFRSRGYLMCGPALRYLQEQVQDLDYLVIVDVNRYRQFTAVPKLFPVVAGFYQRLVAGDLGFTLVKRFKRYPALGGWQFRDDGAEPSFIGFDHPAVLIFKRNGPLALRDACARWEEDLEDDPECADRVLRQAVLAFREGRLERAREEVQVALERNPDMRVGNLLEAAIYSRMGDASAADLALALYRAPYRTESQVRGPWATATNLVELGLQDLQVWVSSFAPSRKGKEGD